MTDPPAEPYLKAGKVDEVSHKLAIAYNMLHQVRLTLAASHQPEHQQIKEALQLVYMAKVAVTLRAVRGQANQRVLVEMRHND